MNEHPPFPDRVGCGKKVMLGLLATVALIGACVAGILGIFLG